MRRILAVVASLAAVVTLSAAGWPTDHGSGTRSGWLPTQTRFSKLTQAFTKALDGAVYASPILVGSNVIVATENNTVYALNATTGAQVWMRHLHTPVPRSSLPCGNIDPLGITGTPVYDATTNRIFLMTESPDPTTVARHEIFGLNATTGATEVNRRIEVPGEDPKAQQQRAALADDGKGNIFIAFGGLAGDCGNYKGEVVSLKASGALGATGYIVPTPREGGIWAAGGPAIWPDGEVFVAVGNGASTTTFDYSDSVTALNANATRHDYFAPTTWAHDNANDLDLGSMTPVLLTQLGYVLQAGKSGQGYVLNRAHLGGLGHPVYQAALCTAFGVAAATTGPSYQVVIMPCTNGVTRVEVSPNGHFVKRWTQSAASGSPVIGNGAIFTLGGSTLYALGVSGNIVGSVNVGSSTTRFATPALGPNMIYVGTTTGVFAATVS